MAQLLVVNRRRAKKRRARAARGAHGRFVKRHRARRTNRRKRRHVARRRSRRSTAVVQVNRRRRRRVNRRHVARRSHSRRRRSNPRLLGAFKPREIVGKVMAAGIGATGALALDIILGKVQASLPVSLQSGWAFTGVKVAGAIGLGWASSKLIGQEKAKLVTYGALTIIAYNVIRQLIKDNAPQFASSVGLAAYMSDYTAYPNMGYVDPAPRLSGLHAYMPSNNGMAAYMAGGGVDTFSGCDDGM